MELPITIICLSLLALLGVTTGQRPVPGTRGGSVSFQPQHVRHPHRPPHPHGTYAVPHAVPDFVRHQLHLHRPGSFVYSTPVSSQPPTTRSPRPTRPPQPSHPDATEEPVTLSGIYTPANNGTAEFEALIALAGRPTRPVNPLLQKFLHDVTQSLQVAIHSANLDPLAVGRLGFDVGNIEVKIDPGTFNGLSSVVLNGGLLENPHGQVIRVTVSGHLGELMGVSGGLARQHLKRYVFAVSSTTDSITVQMDVKLDRVACTLTVEDVNIKLGKIKVEVTGVPSIIDEIKNSVVLKFGFHLEKLLNSQSYDLKILINTALSSIPKSDTFKNKLDCDRHK